MTPEVVCEVLDIRSERARMLPARGFAAVDHEAQSAIHSRRRRLAYALLLALLERELGSGPWTLTLDRRGKPGIAELAGDRRLGISLSHGGDMAAVVLSRLGAVGLDIEPHRGDRNLQGIAGYGFGPREQQAVATGGARAFFRIWTLREAMGKATGDGLALATDGRDRTPALPEEGAWLQEDGRWLLAHRIVPEGYSLAIAIQPHDPMATTGWSWPSIRWIGLE